MNTSTMNTNTETVLNPLLEQFNTLHDTAPFTKIKNEHYLPAFQKAIELAKAEIQSVIDNPAEPTFENTVEAMERTGERLSIIRGIFFNLNSAETSDEMQKIAQDVAPMLSEFGNDISLNEDLFARVKAVYATKK